MILKWLDPQGSWHFKDGVTEVINHGWVPYDKARAIVTEYDGEDCSMFDNRRENLGSKVLLLTLYFPAAEYGREHWLMDPLNAYLMTDSGKTVERI